jgi:hypothetical protein
MADRLRWWVIPAALLVMARVVTLGEPSIDQQPLVVPATGKTHGKQAHEATAARLRLPADQLDTAAERGFVVALPSEFAGVRARCTLWRRAANGREAAPWLTFTSTVRDDGTVPISGLAAGHYDVVVRVPNGGRDVEFAVDDAVAPGRAAMATPAPLR